jgi:hypothetical protein
VIFELPGVYVQLEGVVGMGFEPLGASRARFARLEGIRTQQKKQKPASGRLAGFWGCELGTNANTCGLVTAGLAAREG